MSVVAKFFKGMLSVITVTAAPQLYRYPYRTSSEGLRGDMQRVGGDIDVVLGRFEKPNKKKKGKRNG